MRGSLVRAGLLAALALLLALPVAWQVLDAYRQPAPYTLSRYTPRGVYQHYVITAERTRFAFPADCAVVRWRVYGARAVYVNDGKFDWIGERNLCDGAAPVLKLLLRGGQTLTLTLPRWSPMTEPANAALLLASAAAACAALVVSGVPRARLWARPAAQGALAGVLVVGGVVALDLFTNSLDTVKFGWDFVHYIEMAQYGIGRDFQGLVAPFAYRPVTPLLAGFLGGCVGRSVIAGFRAVAYLGAVAQLMLVFVLARHFTRRLLPALVAVAVVAFSLFNTKFLLFDIYRPDHLAHPLMVIAVLAVFRKNIIVCLLATTFGLLVREFLIVPVLMLLYVLARDFWQTRRRASLLWIGVTLAATAAALIAPRALIVVARSSQSVDVNGLLSVPLNLPRDVNLLFGLFSYLLPTLLLATPARLRRVWARLDGYRVPLGICTLAVLGLTLYGGTDIMRFTPYLFIPQVIVVVLLLDDARPLEIAFMLAAVFVFNRIWMMIPMDSLDTYLDFYGAWEDRVNAATLVRTLEASAYLLGAAVLRALLDTRRDAPVPQARRS